MEVKALVLRQCLALLSSAGTKGQANNYRKIVAPVLPLGALICSARCERSRKTINTTSRLADHSCQFGRAIRTTHGPERNLHGAHWTILFVRLFRPLLSHLLHKAHEKEDRPCQAEKVDH